MLIDDGIDYAMNGIKNDLIPILNIFCTLLDLVQLLLVHLLTLRLVRVDSLSCDGLPVQYLEVFLAAY